MVCAGTQPTLPTAARDLVPYAQSLGLVRLAAWYALELSTSTEAPFSTGTSLSHALLRRLEDAGAIRVSQAPEPSIRRSLYEPLAWCYPIDWGEFREGAASASYIRQVYLMEKRETPSEELVLLVYIGSESGQLERAARHMVQVLQSLQPRSDAVIDVAVYDTARGPPDFLNELGAVPVFG